MFLQESAAIKAGLYKKVQLWAFLYAVIVKAALSSS
jgi:hypothetical protein